MFCALFLALICPLNASSQNQQSVLMIIAQNNFRDEELFTPKEFFESKGVKVTVACSSKRPAIGMFGRTVTPDITINEIDIKKYDALILVGGIGATQYYNDKRVHNLAKSAYNSKKIVAAICLAPVTLANAGLLRGKKATVFNTASRFIIRGGAKYEEKSVVVDGRIITANGPAAADEFARTIYSALTGNK
ncbi:MAG: DJ-1/PfpI family protein [Candidatus Schekmanbacteria bacterium]|nr:MAG: DJ-1/PfpI family protein [Candidatus Schekmanbacteria bacterium]